MQAVSDTVANGGRILFVGTKRQAQDAIAEAAKKSAQYYVNSRWLGGTLTNWKTVSNSIKRLRTLDEMLSSNEAQGYTKKERLTLQRERDKLDRALGGIKDMGGLPDLVFVIDTNKEDIAIKEARRLNVPVAAVVDTNCDPDGITYVVPGNDDASRAITLYCDLVAKAVIDGISRGAGRAHRCRRAAGAGGRGDCRRRPTSSASSRCPDRAASPTISRNSPACRRPIEKQLNDLGIFHVWQIAELSPIAAHNIGEEVGLARPRRRLDRAGQGTDGARGRVSAVIPGRGLAARGPGIHIQSVGVMDSGLLASLGPGMTGSGRSPGRHEERDNDEHHRRHGERAPRQDRRGHDGLQGGARRDRRRSRGRGRLAAQEGSGQGRQEGRAASPPKGLIGVALAGNKGVVVEVNSETDFVARNDLFQGLVKMIADVALDAGTDVDKILAAPIGDRTVGRRDQRDHRQDRREHDAAPRRRAFGRQGRGRELRAQLGRPTALAGSA